MTASDDTADLIGIVGMAVRFPGANDVEEFWDRLRSGEECLTRFSVEELLESGVSPAEATYEGYVPVKGFVSGADQFDGEFFGYSAREAELIDPQHRVFLECCWSALDLAGCNVSTFPGRIGVFAGSSLNTYLLNNLYARDEVMRIVGPYQLLQASDKDFLATRVAYKLGLRGPAVTVQTACSTSLVATHMACQSLLLGESDVALAGGVSVHSPLKQGYVFEPGGIASPDGRCRPFDAAAHGTVPGDGVGVVVLRRLADALRDGDPVVAVIRGSAMNNDGSQKVGYTAPSVDGQTEVIAEALAIAGCDPDSIDYVETHGTGTELGDRIELAALQRVIGDRRSGDHPCAIGSVKSNIGHLDAAAGIAGLVKTALMLSREEMVATPGFQHPNEDLARPGAAFCGLREVRSWPRRGTPRRAGVSSFGIGGTNVHVILEEAPVHAVREEPSPAQRPALLRLSARTGRSLAGYASDLADALESQPEISIPQVAAALAARGDFARRLPVLATDPRQAVDVLRQVTTKSGRDVGAVPPKAVFLFPGQGSQHPSMGHDLYREDIRFRTYVDDIANLFAAETGTDLRPLVFADRDDVAAATQLASTEVTQPALFLVEWALARYWMDRGVQPTAFIGHSIGEYVAATLAGVFDVADAVRVVAERGRLVAAMPEGDMLSVAATEAGLSDLVIGTGATISALNSTAVTAVSGSSVSIAALVERLDSVGVAYRRLRTSHAFHSASMDDAVEPLTRVVRRINLRAPIVPFASNVTGRWIRPEEACDPEYWGRQLRSAVRFADAVGEALQDPTTVFIEMGPGQQLQTLVRAHSAATPERVVVSSQPKADNPGDGWQHTLRFEGELWACGVPVDPLPPDPGARRLRIPPYHFDRTSYWVNGSAPAFIPSNDSGAVQCRYYTPTWSRRTSGLGRGTEDLSNHSWLVIGAGESFAGRFTAEFAERRRRVVLVDADSSLDFLAATVRECLRDTDRLRVVHMGSVETDPGLTDAAIIAARVLGIESLGRVAAALTEAASGVAVSVDIVTSGAFDVTGAEELRPANAMVAALGAALGAEIDGITVRVLDVGTEGLESSDTMTGLISVLDLPVEEPLLAIRGGHVWARSFEEVSPGEAEDAASALRPGGLYLITGGLGDVGLAHAGEIARRTEAPVLALIGRSSLPPRSDWERVSMDRGGEQAERIHQLLELESAGAQVEILQGDVADSAWLGPALRQLVASHGPVRGVVHAAGVATTGLLADVTSASLIDALRAKVDGVVSLTEALDLASVDWVLLCSSVTGVIGGLGQAAYGAANSFLDTAASALRRAGAPRVTSVDWGRWEGLGLARNLGARGAHPTHPLLALAAANERVSTFVTTLTTAEHWIINDHRLMGRGLVPGTAYLDLVAGALGPEWTEPREFRDVLFVEPVVVADGQPRRLYTILELTGSGIHEFRVRSWNGATGQWHDHAVGRVAAVPSEGSGRSVIDIDELRTGLDVVEVLRGEKEVYDRAGLEKWTSGPITFEMGPRWRTLRTLEIGGSGDLLATLSLPDEFVADLTHYALHPALLDIAVGVFRLFEKDNYLPMGYGMLRQHAPLAKDMVCVSRPHTTDGNREVLSCDMDIIDLDGHVLVEITDYTVKRINDSDRLSKELLRDTADESDRAPQLPGDDSRISLMGALARGMTREQGIEAVSRLLGSSTVPAQVLVVPGHLDELQRLADSVTLASLASGDAAGAAVAHHGRPELDTPFVEARSDLERQVAAIWSAALGVSPIGMDDDFFALGGHSLAAVQIASRIRNSIGRDFDLKEFYSTPTIAHLAALLTTEAITGPDPEITQVHRRHSPVGATVEGLSDDDVETQLEALLAEDLSGRAGPASIDNAERR